MGELDVLYMTRVQKERFFNEEDVYKRQMPYYSDELIEEVRSRNDIVDVIGSYVHLCCHLCRPAGASAVRHLAQMCIRDRSYGMLYSLDTACV